MFDRTFGHFVRVLVDIDLASKLKYRVLVERKGYAWFVDLDYENLPEFCNNCNITGHHVSRCRRFKSSEEEKKEKEIFQKKKERAKNLLRNMSLTV